MNLKGFIQRRKVQPNQEDDRGRRLKAYRNRGTPDDKLTPTEIARLATDAGYPMRRETVHRHATLDELPSVPTADVLRGYGVAFHTSVAVPAVASLVSVGLAEGWLADLTEKACELIESGVMTPQTLLTILDRLSEYGADNVVVLPVGAPDDDCAAAMRIRALEHVNRLRGQPHRLPSTRTPVE
jgi:hypothetical protein